MKKFLLLTTLFLLFFLSPMEAQEEQGENSLLLEDFGKPVPVSWSAFVKAFSSLQIEETKLGTLIESIGRGIVLSLVGEHADAFVLKNLDGCYSIQGYKVAVKSIPFFSQRNPSWSSQLLGTSSVTIGTAGCALTASVMLLKFKNPSNGAINPGTVNTWLKNNWGYQSGNLLVWSQLAQYDGSGGLVWVGTDSISSLAALKSKIDSGKLILAKSTRFPSHFVTLRGYVNAGIALSDFQYQDPYDLTYTLRNFSDGFVGIGSSLRVYQ